MKKLSVYFALIVMFAASYGCKYSNDPSKWSAGETEKWFNNQQWLGDWNVKPDPSINSKELAGYYFLHKERWDKAFGFLSGNDLAKLEARRYDIDGDNVYAIVSESVTKNEEDVKFEAHRKYIDIQYVIDGSEQMSITPLSQKKEELVAYDPDKDVEFLSVTGTSNHEAAPDRFFIFFPSDIHRPSVKIGENKPVKKVVVKVRAD